MSDTQASDPSTMPVDENVAIQKPASLPVRWRSAGVIVVVTAVTILALQFSPGEYLPAQFRNFLSIVSSALGMVSMLVWIAAFSRFTVRTKVVLLTVSAIGLLIPASMIRGVEFTGDIVPTFVFRWEPTQLETLKAHRAEAARSSEAIDDQLSTGEDLAANWPGFRGADRSGICTTTTIRADWENHPPESLWKQPVGGGYAQFSLLGNVAVTIEQRGPNEAVVAYDARDGSELWVHSYPTFFSEAMGGDGPRATPTIDGDLVFALGANGRLSCLQTVSGELVWQQDILKDATQKNLEWGMSGSPLVLEDVVIVNPGAAMSATGDALVAYDRATGTVVWGVGDSTAGYASPTVAVIDGVKQILILDGQGGAGYASDGSVELWRFPWETQGGINCSQPIMVTPNRVLITAGYTMGSALLELTKNAQGQWNAEPVWVKSTLRGKFSTPIAHDGFIYGLDEGVMVCVDAETGKRTWKRGRYGHGQMLLVGDVFFIQAEDGDIALVAVDPEEHRELGRIPVFDARTWNTPAIAGGRAYVRNHREMACFGLSPDDTSPTLGLSEK